MITYANKVNFGLENIEAILEEEKTERIIDSDRALLNRAAAVHTLNAVSVN